MSSVSLPKKRGRLGYSVPARIFLLLFFTGMAILVMIPLYAMLLNSFKGGTEMWRNGLNLRLEPEKLQLDSWRYLFTGITPEGEYLPHSYFAWFKNSLFLTVVQTVLGLFISALVAYGFAMYNFKGKNFLFICVLMVMMVPFEILMLPMYIQANSMGLLDSYWGIILPFMANTSAIFFFRQFLTGVPGDLLNAARVDGCTEYGIFFRVVLPIMAPAMSSMAVLIGMGSWNNLLWPMLVITSMSKYTLPLGLNTLFTPYGNNYDLMICGSVFAILPILLLFLFAQKYIIEGMTAGSVKG